MCNTRCGTFLFLTARLQRETSWYHVLWIVETRNSFFLSIGNLGCVLKIFFNFRKIVPMDLIRDTHNLCMLFGIDGINALSCGTCI